VTAAASIIVQAMPAYSSNTPGGRSRGRLDRRRVPSQAESPDRESGDGQTLGLFFNLRVRVWL
jgi:hypothetical protein